jgi:hypothetical protein
MNSIILKILILTWFALFPIAANIEAFNAWSFLIGVVFIAIPILILTWSEKGSEANRIAHQLAIDAESFLKEERDKVGYSFFSVNDKDAFDKDVLPLENERFRIIATLRGMSWYSKEYDAWFLRYDGFIYYCDHNQNVICVVQNPHKFDLKKYLIPDRDVKELNKNSDYWE